MIISGLLGIIGTMSYWVGIGEAGSGFGKGDMPPFVPSIIYGLPLPALVIAIGAVAGGVIAILRKKWGWALAAAVAGALSFILLGIPALILIVLAKDEFNSKNKKILDIK